MLALVVGWRWLDDPVRLGTSSAAGALAKLQPGLVLGWAALVGRWRAVAVGAIVGLTVSLIATAVVGPGAWFDYATLLRQVNDPITTPHNFTPGAIAFQLTGSADLGATVQLVASVLVIASVLVAARWATTEASYLVVVVASQLLSPTLWDHYAIVLCCRSRGSSIAAGRWRRSSRWRHRS